VYQKKSSLLELTKCIAELLGGCGSISNCDGVWPKLRIWFSIACNKQHNRILYYIRTT